ncbi:jacalin-related lectin 4-like [Rhodamnia argentea]|uniref:Jacalin-related lectin 4-like n=1 Tax=Rhodamnia argentea TaxID=178133 RepID=A0ABM3GUX8_9MYRT|nr:jacalin-related lectin 4-like [Rhodamnia argentea]
MGIEEIAGCIPCSSSSVHRWKYDVFVSFKGEDIRKTFAAHLFRALKQAGFSYFEDKDKVEAGIFHEPNLVDTICHSRVSLVVFTADYADSRLGLDELVEILECNRRFRDHQGHVVLPIFYDVEPSDVRKQSGGFGDGFGRCLATQADDLEVQKWRDSLKEAGNLSGWHLSRDANGDQTDFIEQIVGHLFKIIPRTSSPCAIGVDSFVDDVISLLQIGSEDDVRVVGIWGMEGIGKTTVAKVVCDRLFREFEGISFLENVGDANEGTILLLQKRLLHDVLQVQGLDIYDFNSNVNDIKHVLHRKRILLVLDGITKKDQIEYFGAGDREWLQYGSRILITTREEQLLEDLKVDDKYMLPGLGSKESLQLMSRHTFSKDQPKEGYEELSKSLVHYAGGLPMVLERFGSFLSSKKNQWHEILEKLVKDPHLDSIGISLDPFSSLRPSVGPFGGHGGDSFDDQTFSDIRKITIVVGSVIESITIEYDQNGCLVSSPRHGGSWGGQAWAVPLDYPNEYLISVFGYITEDSYQVINSLIFHSNKRSYGPFGNKEGKFFKFPPVDGKIIGFHGSCGFYLDSIGAYFGPVSHPYPFEVIGPFGNGENRWDDGKNTDVRQIVVVSGSAIESINITYEEGRSFGHGASDGGEINTINLDWLTEYLTSVSGYIANDLGSTIIHSLTFQSNKRTYGPFGTETGRKFSFPATGGKIIGFYGSSGSHLQSLGAYFEPISHLYPIKYLGPFGGQGGDPWDDGKFNGVKKIKIMLENVVNCISFEYDACGESIWSSTHGHSGNGDIRVVNLDYPREFLTSVSGYIRPDYPAIQSLTFESNIRRHGPFGKEEGRSFSCSSTCNKIIGFHGRSSVRLDALGVYSEPISDLRFLKSIGPFGGHGGSPWEDGDSTGVREIIVKGGSAIDSITVEYDKNGSVVQGPRHGGDGGHKTLKIKLDYPREYLISFSGYFGDISGYTLVRSLTFRSNEKTFGPIGVEDGKYFSLPSTGRKIVRFHGRSGLYLDSLGAHFELEP